MAEVQKLMYEGAQVLVLLCTKLQQVCDAGSKTLHVNPEEHFIFLAGPSQSSELHRHRKPAGVLTTPSPGFLHRHAPQGLGPTLPGPWGRASGHTTLRSGARVCGPAPEAGVRHRPVGHALVSLRTGRRKFVRK